MNLETSYLGLTLRNPIVIGASPFCDNIDACRRLEEAGAAALVMHSLFEEQIEIEQQALLYHLETPAESHFEATSYFPNYSEYHLTPDTYLKKLEQLKSSLTIPVMASLNGRRPGGGSSMRAAWNPPGPMHLNSTPTRSPPTPRSPEKTSRAISWRSCAT